VLKTLDPSTFHGSNVGDVALTAGSTESTLDITARMKEMW